MKGRFILWLLLVAAGLSVAFFFLLPLLPAMLQFEGFIYIILFFTLATILFHYGLSKSAATGSKHFVRFYVAATALKMILYVAIIIFYALVNKDGVKGFAFTFLVCYAVFTVFETAVAYNQFGSVRKNTATLSAEESE